MTVAGLALGLASAFAAGALLAWRFWPERAKPAGLIAALAWPAGLSLTSSAYFVWMLVSGGRAAWVPALELAGLLAAALLVVRRARALGERFAFAPGTNGAVLAGLVALGVLALVVLAWTVAAVRTAEVTPWGYWDAWARIGLKARFLSAGGADWTWIFHGDGVPHRDYPLLLECATARLSRFSGGDDPLPAQVLSVLNWAASVAALLVLVARLRSWFLAAAAGIALACHRSDLGWVSMQYADFVLASLFTWSAGLLVLARESERPEAWWPLAGFCAGSAAWCKDEGIVFAIVVLVLVAVHAFATGRRTGVVGLALGTLLGGGATLIVKLGFAGKSELLGDRARPFLEDLTDPSRYRRVGEHLLEHLSADTAGWALLALLLAVLVLPCARPVRRSWLPLGLAAAMALAFLLVLVTTREDLDWHVTTTIDRLVLQLWPLAILGAAAALGRTDAKTPTTDACSSAS